MKKLAITVGKLVIWQETVKMNPYAICAMFLGILPDSVRNLQFLVIEEDWALVLVVDFILVAMDFIGM